MGNSNWRELLARAVVASVNGP